MPRMAKGILLIRTRNVGGLAGLWLAFCFLTFLGVSPARSEPAGTNRLAKLRFSGRLKGSPAGMTLDVEALERLPQGKVVTETPWVTGMTTFEGPLMSTLLESVGAQGEKVRIVALNDYTIDVPVSDFKRWPVVLATRINGKRIPVSRRGPFYMMYPFTADKSLYTEIYFARCVWQIKSIEIL